jgi:hypothetical protein
MLQMYLAWMSADAAATSCRATVVTACAVASAVDAAAGVAAIEPAKSVSSSTNEHAESLRDCSPDIHCKPPLYSIWSNIALTSIVTLC